jgi:hypothetical protein
MRALHLSALLTAMLVSTLAHGAVQRTFVSTGGNDANTVSNCSLVAPCRSFGAALGVTLVRGEVIVLDSGGYGPVTITQSVTIEAPAGVYAGISVTTGTGVVVNAPGGTVALRGLAINGIGGLVGIEVQAANRFDLERARVSGMGQRAIHAHAAGSRNVISDVRVSDTSGIVPAVEVVSAASADIERVTIARSGGPGLSILNVDAASVRESAVVDSNLSGQVDAAFGVVALSGAVAHASIERVTVSSATGSCLVVNAAGGGSMVFGDVSHSVFANCSTANAFNQGIIVVGSVGGVSHVAVVDCVVRNSQGSGVNGEGAGTTLTVSRSTITDNGGQGLVQGVGSIVYTRLDNTLRGNNGQETTNQTSGTITMLTPH